MAIHVQLFAYASSTSCKYGLVRTEQLKKKKYPAKKRGKLLFESGLLYALPESVRAVAKVLTPKNDKSPLRKAFRCGFVFMVISRPLTRAITLKRSHNSE